MCMYKSIQKQKVSFTGHVLGGLVLHTDASGVAVGATLGRVVKMQYKF